MVKRTGLNFYPQAWLLFCLLGINPFSSQAQEVTVGMGNFEPYFIEQGTSGIFTDLIRAVFKLMPNHQPKFLFGRSNNRLWHDFKQNNVDAVSNLFDSVELDACRSDPIFRFRDVAVSKTSANFKIKKIADLAGKYIVTFQGARSFFGDEFEKTTHSKNGSYREVSRPSWQVQVLGSDSADVSVGDMFIFLHTLKETKNLDLSANDFTFHDIFPAIYTRMGFRDPQVCELFNQGLKKIRANGRYEKIYSTYLRQLNPSH